MFGLGLLDRLTTLSKVVGLVLAGVVITLLGMWGWGQYQTHLTLVRSMGEVVTVINFNLQRGALKLPPQMQPAAPTGPAAASEDKPADAPSAASPTK